MDLVASACLIIAIVASTLLPSVSNSRVLGTKIVRDTSASDSLATTDIDNSDDVDSPRLDAMQLAQDAREATREERQEAREEFRQRLAEIKNAQKRERLEHVSQMLDQINERWAAHFDNVLLRLSEILAKIGTRADKLEEDGQDVVSVRDGIADAEAAIDAAQDAVNTQAENYYVIDIVDEESLKDDVKSVRDELHTDLTAARDAVKTARQAVHDAFQALKDVHSNQDVEEGATDEE